MGDDIVHGLSGAQPVCIQGKRVALMQPEAGGIDDEVCFTDDLRQLRTVKV